MMEKLLMNSSFFNVDYGCPAINLIEEMSPVNETFKRALSRLVLTWQNAIASALQSAKDLGLINANVSPEETAIVILSGYGGVRNLGKILGRSAYEIYLRGLKTYLSKL